MEILLVRGEIRSGSRDAFLETSGRYNAAREAAGLPKYRRLIDMTAGATSDDARIVFMCEFVDLAQMDRADELLDTDEGLKTAIAAMYEHLVAGSVSAMTLRDLD